MKKSVFTIVSLLLSFPVFGQIGYQYGASFIELTPNNSSLYYVQTENKTKLNDLINRTTNMGDSVKIFATCDHGVGSSDHSGVSPQGITNMRSRLMWKLFREGGGARDFDARLQALK